MMRRRLAARRRRGAALIEFALIMPLLMLLLLGIIEFGVMVMHQHVLEQSAREGVRLSAVGGTTAQIDTRIRNTASSLPNAAAIQVILSYSTDNGATFPNTLGDTGEENNAPPGSEIQATLTVSHQLVTGSFFAGLLGAVDNAVPLRARVVMRRE